MKQFLLDATDISVAVLLFISNRKELMQWSFIAALRIYTFKNQGNVMR